MKPPPKASRRYISRWLAPLVIMALLGLSALARDAIGIEWGAASAREFVAGLGWWAPAIFVGLLTFRLFLLIPSQILLPVGGLCFGTLAATVYGTLGLALAGTLVFGLARWAGRDAVLKYTTGRATRFLARTNTGAAALIVMFVTAYPFGPTLPVHASAGLTRMVFGSFAVAVIVGAALRAAAFSFFGSTLAVGEGVGLATGVLLAAICLPLLFPRARTWLREEVSGEPARIA